MFIAYLMLTFFFFSTAQHFKNTNQYFYWEICFQWKTLFMIALSFTQKEAE